LKEPVLFTFYSFGNRREIKKCHAWSGLLLKRIEFAHPREFRVFYRTTHVRAYTKRSISRWWSQYIYFRDQPRRMPRHKTRRL